MKVWINVGLIDSCEYRLKLTDQQNKYTIEGQDLYNETLHNIVHALTKVAIVKTN